jgi:hypothetical protein
MPTAQGIIVSVLLTMSVGSVFGASQQPAAHSLRDHLGAPAWHQGPGAGPLGQALRVFRLLGHQTVLDTTVVLTPADPSVVETLTGPSTLDVQIPADSKRTLVVLELQHSYSYHQIVSSVPLRTSIGARLFIKSSALPIPGSFEALSFFSEGDSVSGSASAQDNVHSVGWHSRYQLDLEFLSISLQFGLGMNPSAADALAATLMQSDMEFTIQPSATVRSVSNVSFGRIRSLQVWGD